MNQKIKNNLLFTVKKTLNTKNNQINKQQVKQQMPEPTPTQTNQKKKKYTQIFKNRSNHRTL